MRFGATNRWTWRAFYSLYRWLGRPDTVNTGAPLEGCELLWRAARYARGGPS